MIAGDGRGRCAECAKIGNIRDQVDQARQEPGGARTSASNDDSQRRENQHALICREIA